MPTTKASAAATAAPAAPAAPITPTPVSAAPTIAGYDQLKANMVALTTLSAEGKACLENIKAVFKATVNDQITVEQIPYRCEAHACIDNVSKQAYIIVFHESYLSSQNTPPTECYPEILKAFRNKHQDISVLQWANLIPADYARAERWAIHIINAFRCTYANYQPNAEVFRSMKLVPCTDVEKVKQYIEKRSPHAVQDRIDWGVLINRVTAPTRLETFQTEKVPDPEPIMAVGGYTKFFKIGVGTVVKYIPICTITNVTADLPCMGMLNLALPIAAGCIIAQRVWERPYATFAKGKPNLGVLQFAADGKHLDWFGSADQMHQACANMLCPPVLAIDCAEGRARIPGIEDMVLRGVPAVRDQFEKFFGPAAVQAVDGLTQPAIIGNIMNFEGIYKTNGLVADTRCADYINMVTETQDYQRCQRANIQYYNPGQHLADVASIYGDDAVTPLYRVYTIIFNSDLINALANMVGSIIHYTGEAMVNQSVDMGMMFAPFTSHIGGCNAIYGNVPGFGVPGSIYGL